MKKQGFLYGSAVLVISALIVKAMGALFRIPLAGMLGGSGMGYFSSAYGIFMPVYALSATGLPAAAASVCAAYEARREGGGRAVFAQSLKLFGAVGAVGTLVLLIGAYPVCMLISGDLRALPSVLAIAPCVLAGCLSSAYRGYFEGMRDMYPTAVSQTVEVIFKVILGLSLCAAAMRFMAPCGDEYALPWASAAASLGITLSAWTGLIYLTLRGRKDIPRKAADGSGLSAHEIRRALIKIALPAALSAMVTNLTSLIDLVTIMRSLRRMNVPDPNFVYGSFAGLAMTLFNLVPSVTNMFGKSILPAASAAAASGDRKTLSGCVEKALLACALIAVPAGIGMTAVGDTVLRALFSGREAEIAVCGMSTAILGMAVPFVCMSSCIFPLLQAAGRAVVPVRIMALGAVVKLSGNIVFMGCGMGIGGAAASTLLCYAVIFAASTCAVVKYCGADGKKLFADLSAVLFSGAACGLAAWFTVEKMGETGVLSPIIATAAAVSSGAVIYLAVGVMTGVISRRTIELMA